MTEVNCLNDLEPVRNHYICKLYQENKSYNFLKLVQQAKICHKLKTPRKPILDYEGKASELFIPRS
jgi:hypothetical protein